MIKIPIDVIASAFPGFSDIQELKTGGQKIVYSAQQHKWGRVVIKLIPPEQINDRISREIQTGQKYNFPHVPHLYDSGEITLFENKFLFIIEQFIDGKDLRYFKNNHYHFSLCEIIELMDSLFITLIELEKVHIVHRDIKLDNILYDKSHKFWLIDFGIARDLDLSSLTATSQSLGPHSLGYASPEQLRNQKKKIDSRSDLFSLGVVVYELLSGENPFIKDATGVIDVINRTETLEPTTLKIAGDKDDAFSIFIQTLMKKNPLWRPPTVESAYKWFKDVVPKTGDI